MNKVDYVKVWCEYDFGGSFGGNSNEEVVVVDESIDMNEVTERLETYLSSRTGLEKEDLEGLWEWNYITPASMLVKDE